MNNMNKYCSMIIINLCLIAKIYVRLSRKKSSWRGSQNMRKLDIIQDIGRVIRKSLGMEEEFCCTPNYPDDIFSLFWF